MVANSANFFKHFFKSEKNSGIILLCCVFVSLLIANSSYHDVFLSVLEKPIGFGGQLTFTTSAWINDGLMAIFFLLVGLEIKREIAVGELSTAKQATLPIFAALGGMLVPALIYFSLNYGESSVSGWGIPMATDIAFALAIVGMLGKRVPLSLKIFLAALAIADDLGAILVIAVFYTEKIYWLYLLMAGGVFALLWIFNFSKIKSLWFYLIPGLLLWYFMHHSGIHATIAGVLLAFTIPMYRKNIFGSPVKDLEHSLVTPVNYLIMPIFALANTNIRFEFSMLEGLFSPIGSGIFCGLFFGKAIGITLFTWIAVKTDLATLPNGIKWQHIIGAGMLAGIGFTMSIFISLLSFDDESSIAAAKFAILCTSIIAGLGGYFYLSRQEIVTEKETDSTYWD